MKQQFDSIRFTLEEKEELEGRVPLKEILDVEEGLIELDELEEDEVEAIVELD